MDTKLQEFVAGCFETPNLEARLKKANEEIEQINLQNKGHVSLNVISHLTKARNNRDAVQKEYDDHINKLKKINEEIFNWLEEHPFIESVVVPRTSQNSANTHLNFNRDEKKINITSAP